MPGPVGTKSFIEPAEVFSQNFFGHNQSLEPKELERQSKALDKSNKQMLCMFAHLDETLDGLMTRLSNLM